MKNSIIFLTLALSCRAQVADFLFPQATKASRNFVEDLSNNPLFAFTTKASSDLFAAAVDAISSGPQAVARALGIGGDVPFIENDNNYRGSDKTFISDYVMGLGNEDAGLPITKLVPKYGFPLEQHDVTTEDGFVLTMFRIPSDGPVVFLMHGVLASADDFFLSGPDDALGYTLARQGYDVWVGNARGNKHSRRHLRMNPADADFWDFSWHEIGYYDLPAMIDYMCNKTDRTNLTYIGHSQGTTAFFVMTSSRPEYNDRISLMIALSPIAFVSNMKSPIIRFLAPGTPIIHAFAKSFGIYEFLPDDDISRILKILICGNGAISDIVCSNLIFILAGYDYPQMNFTNLPVIFGHLPSGAATKQIAHYGQEIISGKFQQFDYGNSGNVKRYGSEEPPSYPLENVTAPVALFYSDADWLAHPHDVEALYKKLQNVVDMHKIPYSQFNHLDFLFAKDVKSLINKRVRKLMKHFSDNA